MRKKITKYYAVCVYCEKHTELEDRFKLPWGWTGTLAWKSVCDYCSYILAQEHMDKQNKRIKEELEKNKKLNKQKGLDA